MKGILNYDALVIIIALDITSKSVVFYGALLTTKKASLVGSVPTPHAYGSI